MSNRKKGVLPKLIIDFLYDTCSSIALNFMLTTRSKKRRMVIKAIVSFYRLDYETVINDVKTVDSLKRTFDRISAVEFSFLINRHSMKRLRREIKRQ